jgi:hypothetical protein
MPRKAKKTVSAEAKENMRLGQLRRQAKLRAAKTEFSASDKEWIESKAASLSAAAISPATEMSFVISSIIARKEQALKTIEDCDIALEVWERLGL